MPAKPFQAFYAFKGRHRRKDGCRNNTGDGLFADPLLLFLGHLFPRKPIPCVAWLDRGTIRYTVYDHFGLDEIDISENNWYKGAFGPFAAWYVLQHYKGSEGRYQPFATYIEFEVPFSGSID